MDHSNGQCSVEKLWRSQVENDVVPTLPNIDSILFHIFDFSGLRSGIGFELSSRYLLTQSESKYANSFDSSARWNENLFFLNERNYNVPMALVKLITFISIHLALADKTVRINYAHRIDICFHFYYLPNKRKK